MREKSVFRGSFFSFMRIYFPARFLLFLLTLSGNYLFSQPFFHFEDNRLFVRTKKLELVIEGGVISSLKNVATGEVFSQGNPWEHLGKMEGKKQLLRPGPESSCLWQQAGADQGILTYTNLPGSKNQLDAVDYYISVDTTSGGVLVKTVIRVTEPSSVPENSSLPLTNLKTRAVILGSGAKYTRQDAPVINYSVRWANNLYSPPLAVVEGERSCLFLWSTDFFAGHNVVIHHEPEADGLFLTTERDLREKSNLQTSSVLWRFDVFPTWLEAVKQYRKSYEKTTGAKPLWENDCPWVRKIHAVHTGAPGGAHGSPSPEESDRYYQKLAEKVDPAKILLFYWNGNGIVAFGDHRYMTRLGWPKEPVVAAIKKYGFRWMAYYPWTLIYSPKGLIKRYQEIKEKNWGFPEGYVFTPDYRGPPEKFYDYFRPVATGYYQPKDKTMEEMEGLWVLHPGSRLVREYLVRNYGNYCAFHGASGCYFDILGADHGYMFPAERKVMDGFLYRDGEAVALKELRKAHPHLAIMSECQSQWTVPYTFYTWEGASHFTLPRAYPSIKSKLNHPLRTALWGSYTWTREAGIEPDESALVGGLPELNLKDDWSVARVKLFTEEELFNDLPEKWEEEALAYYRGRNGKWFQYRKLPYGDGYVELTGKTFQPRLVRLSGVTSSPFSEPCYIQGWPAMRDNQPLGLNPRATYFLVPGKKQEEQPFTITGISEGVIIQEFHHSGNWSVVSLETIDGKEKECALEILFQQPCLQILDSTGEIFKNAETSQKITVKTFTPGGLVLLWKEVQPKDGRIRSDFIAARGQTLANGLPDRDWSYNQAVLRKNYQLAGKEYPCVALGTGRFRGYTEQWISLVENSKPSLKFDLAYDSQDRSRSLPAMVVAVAVNGKIIWQDHLERTKDWKPVEISLGAWTGRTVLITLSAWLKEGRNISPGPDSVPVYFGRVRVDNNPHSLQELISRLPPPAEVLFQNDFQTTPGLKNNWYIFTSPAQVTGGGIKAENGKLILEGKHYKYQYLARQPGKGFENISVQARFQIQPTGGDTGWNPGIKLYWGKGNFCSFCGGNDQLVISGHGQRRINLAPRRMAVTDNNFYDFWLKISLTEEKIRYFSSLDGQTWNLEAEIKRPDTCKQAPVYLIIGRGREGEGEVFQNDEKWDSTSSPCYISEFIVSRET